MEKIRGKGSRGEEDSQSEGPGKDRDGLGEETSQHSHKKMGYLVRSEQALLLVKEDLTAT